MHRDNRDDGVLVTRHSGRIKLALEALLRREGPDRSVIFQERTSEKFVQFAGSAEEPLLLDLQSIPLSAAEMERAKTFFAKLGVTPGPLFGDHVTFQLKLGRDVDRATELALSVFQAVYSFPPGFEIDVIEN